MGATPHGFIGKHQALSGANKTAVQIAEKLFTILLSKAETAQAMSLGIVNVLGSINTWAGAREIMIHVEKVKTANLATIDLLESFLKTNDQVAGAYGVPERIASVLARWRLQLK